MLKKRLVLVAVAAALVAVATAANRLPIHLAGSPPAPASPAAANDRPVALPIPRVKAPPSPVAAAPRRRTKAVSPVMAWPPAAAELPPSIVLAAPPDARPVGMPIALAPVPDPPHAASPVAAAAAAPTVSSPLVSSPPVAAMQTPAAGPADSNNLWVEKQGTREQPEIHLFNRSRLSGELVITRGTARRAWSWRRPGLVISDTVDPVEYAYEIRGPIYRMTGRPDVAGSLRCRKYRVYEVEVWERAPWEGWDTMYRDLGD